MKLGIIGLGSRMSDMLKAFRAADPGLEIVGVVDSNPEQARQREPEEKRAALRFYDTLPELVEQARPDALAIATRCDGHAPYAIQAARYDLPLYLEKPIATSLADAIALERAFETSRCQALVSFPLRASLLCRRTRALIEQGAVGRVEHICARNYVPYGDVYFLTWYRDYSITQGLFLQKATHDLDYMMYLAGAPIVRVAAMLSQGRCYRDQSTQGEHPDPYAKYAEQIGTPETGMNEDSSSALVEFANGAQGVYTQVFYSKRDAGKRGAIISGYSGTLDFDWYRNDLINVHHHEPFTETTQVEKGLSHFGGDTVLAENFVAMVHGGVAPVASIQDGLRSVYACLAARESAQTGCFIPVRQVGA